MTTIFLHGMGQTPASWDDTIRSLRDQGEHLVPDLYQMTGPGEAGIRKLYRNFAKACQQLPDRPLNLVAHSLGGMVALRYAADYPEEVRSLALIATQYDMRNPLARFQTMVFRLLGDAAYETMGVEKQDFIDLSRSLSTVDLSRSLGKISCPVLVICGEKDKFTRRSCEELVQRLPYAQLWQAPGAGHEVNVDAPAQLAKKLDDFFTAIR